MIFAWFEDKKAVLKWYYSDTHREVMNQFFPDSDRKHKPLAQVPDDTGPIMMIASVTWNAKPTKEDPSPFKQIAIEVYQPLKGGLAIGGSFGPKAHEGARAEGVREEVNHSPPISSSKRKIAAVFFAGLKGSTVMAPI